MSSEKDLNKKQRGRLKKLRKRVQEVKECSETSGLTSAEDLQELRELDCTLQIGPSIRLRTKSSYGGAYQRADGEDHRSILCQLFQRTNQTKKRVRDELTVSPIPPWTTLHNPVATQSIAVIEIQWEHSPESWVTFLQQIPIVEQLLQNKRKEYSVLPVETRWFQGSNVRSISDALMYIPRSQHSQKSERPKKEKDMESPRERIPALLNELALNHSQLTKGGFPLVDPNSISKEASTLLTTCNDVSLPKNISQEVALKTILERQVPVVLRDDRNNHHHHPFIQTVPLQGGQPPSIFALDCEMVNTSFGQELARVTLIELADIDADTYNITYEVILDELVKPDSAVLDYVTEFSGITAKMLDPVSTSLAQIQASLVTILHKEDTLIGHSLENDLLSLHMIHENVVDTAAIFRATNGRTYSLKHVTAALLRRQIQNGSGHCSEEDALAALELAVRRALNGHSFRIFESSDDRLHILDILRHEKEPIVAIGPGKWISRYITSYQNSAHALSCESIQDANRNALVAWLSSQSRRARFAWANFAVKNNQSDINELNKLMTGLIERILPGTMLLISMQGCHQATLDLMKQRKACQNPKSSLGWSIEQERVWENQIEACRSGIALWVGK